MMGNFLERIPHIGIVAGTAEGAALCYRTLCLEAESVMGRRYAHPEVTLHSCSLHRYLDAIDQDDWSGVAALLSQSAAKLARVGADVIICPNNTLHKAFRLVESPVPWVHIAKPVAREIEANRWRRVGILGTQTVMEGSVYSEQLYQSNIGIIAPEQDDRSRIQHIIRDELIAGVSAPESALFVRKVIADMAINGAEAVILACTELPLLMAGHQATVPLLDSTRLLAQAALRYRVREERPAEGKYMSDRRSVMPAQENMFRPKLSVRF
ncbi:aspartate/glutamate racemase family protein [Candidatus Nitrospira nitrificans]|uniref:Aspartate racemase n=1 Tax=Candidatus Nitrospira nitrificans TaxID=1742973 RepID=A0A0S4LCF5_9BACT|nr:amino acid racemase [Candidatus Nitrospira nitrificans]CUS33579.1 Aspartate racemase [Candidatus Nitrospira nitrificans]